MIKQSMAISSMLFAQNTFIAVGSGYAFYSTDGTNWYEGGYTPNLCFKYAAYGNGKFVTIGSDKRTLKGYCSTSANGINWTSPSNFSTNVTWNNLGFGNERFIAIGKNGYIMTSANGRI